MLKAKLEIVCLNDDVVLASGSSSEYHCECDTFGAIGQDHEEDDC